MENKQLTNEPGQAEKETGQAEKKTGEYAIVLCTCPDKATARRIARRLVQERLAACVQAFPIESVYIWQGEVCEDAEMALLIKSRAQMFPRIAAAIKEIHPYEIPEIVRLPIADGWPPYLDWIEKV